MLWKQMRNAEFGVRNRKRNRKPETEEVRIAEFAEGQSRNEIRIKN